MSETKNYVFFREGFFYPIDLPADAVIADHVLCNPGTLRVEDDRGNIVWPVPAEKRS